MWAGVHTLAACSIQDEEHVGLATWRLIHYGWAAQRSIIVVMIPFGVIVVKLASAEEDNRRLDEANANV
jgi:invasion protein IalB